MAYFGEDEWYFFTPRAKKYPKGTRPNRAADRGYWKATGTDKPVVDDLGRKIGLKKSLVFYTGDTKKGSKSNWIMHEYRLTEGMAPTATRQTPNSNQVRPRAINKIRKFLGLVSIPYMSTRPLLSYTNRLINLSVAA